MPFRHTVQRGDNLWGLAHRYLGSGTKWRAILDCHNQHAAKPGRHKLLIPIEDPNLIYVDQYIMVPGRRKKLSPEAGNKKEAGQIALPIDLKITYAIGRDTPPVVYVQKGVDYTVTTEMSGQISIELRSVDRFRHNLELLMSKSPNEAKSLLQQNYDPALCALTAKPGIEFESGRVTIKPAIAAEAGIGPYTVELQAVSPLQLSGKLKPSTMEGTVTASSREYNYSADLEFKVDVILEPKPRGGVEKQVRLTEPQPRKDTAVTPAENSMDWQKITTAVAWTIIGIGLAILGHRTMPTPEGATTIQPIFHTVDPNNPRSRGYYNRNA